MTGISWQNGRFASIREEDIYWKVKEIKGRDAMERNRKIWMQILVLAAVLRIFSI